MKHLANEYFKSNLRELQYNGDFIKVRPKYKDGEQAECISIKQVFEKYDLRKDSVLHNLRPTAIKTAIQEMFWIYQDQTSSLEKAHERGIYWWDEFNVGDGTIGQAYGHTVYYSNLMNELLYWLENNPFSRRHILNLYQYSSVNTQLQNGGLVPCAYETTWSVDSDYNVDMTLVQRSSDYITANAINKIQYVALLEMVCGHLRHETGVQYKPRYFSHFVQDLHIYDRHISALNELIEINPSTEKQTIELLRDCNFYDYTIDDFKINKIEIPKIKSTLELAI